MSKGLLEDNSLELKLRYLGDRFQKHTLSCDDTQDIAVFGKMLTKLATHVLKSADSKELSDINLKNLLYFEFGGISKGSSVAEITITPDLEKSSDSWNPSDKAPNPIHCVKEAYRILMEIINGSKTKENFEYFKIIEHDMAKFGKGLADGEEIDFLESEKYTAKTVRYTRNKMKEIKSAHNCRATNRIVGTGTMTGFKANGHVFINSEDYGKFTFKGHPNKVRSVFDGCIGAKAEFVLGADLNLQNKISRIIKHYYLELAPKNDQSLNAVEFCMQQLNKYAKYEHGWLDGEGEKINRTAVSEAKKFISMAPELANRYLISPTPEGYVFIEFICDGWKKCLEFSDEGIETFGHDIGERLGKFQRTFERSDSDLAEFISNFKGEMQ